MEHVLDRGRIAPVVIAAEMIDGNDGGAVASTAVVAPPLLAGEMVVLGRSGFTDHDRVRQAVDHGREVDLVAEAIEAATDVTGIRRRNIITVIGTPIITPHHPVR